jgi:hypothetical protein
MRAARIPLQLVPQFDEYWIVRQTDLPREAFQQVRAPLPEINDLRREPLWV